MTKPTTSNKDFFNIILDLETTGLGIHLPPVTTTTSGLRELMSAEELDKSFAHLDISQIGWQVKEGSTYHQSIAVNSRSFTRKDTTIKDSFREGSLKIDNVNVKTKKRLVNTVNRQDNYNTIFKDGAKGTERYRTEEVNRSRVKNEAYYDFKTPDSRRVFAAKKPLEFMSSHGELNASEEDIINGRTWIAKKLKEKGVKVLPGVSQKTFEGKGEGSLYNIVEKLYVNQIKKGIPVAFQGWNPYFDLEVLRGMLKKFGHLDLLTEIDRAYYSGLIKVEGLETIWQAVAFKLSQENPEVAKNFLIHINPEAVAATGRVGKVAQTFTESKFAIPWKAEFAAKALSYNKTVNQSLKEGFELHAAGADVRLEKALADETRSIYKAYLDELAKDGIIINSVEEFVSYSPKDPQFFHRVLDSRIKAEAAKTMDSKAIKNVKEFESLLLKSGKESSKYIKEQAVTTATKALEKSARSRLIRMSITSGITTSLLMATYGLMDEDNRVDISNSKLSKRTLFGKKRKLFDYKNRFEHDPKKTSETLKLISLGMAAPALAMYGIGLHQAINTPRLLGRTVQMPNSIGGAAKEFLKTVRYGAKFAEAHIPTLRVTRISALLDALIGRGNLSYDKVTGEPKRSIRFTSWEAGRARDFQDVYGKGKEFSSRHRKYGVYYDDFLEKAKQELNVEQYKQLENIFNPKEVTKHTDKVIVHIANSKNGAVVYARALDKAGKEITDNRFQKIRVSFQVADIYEREPNVRNAFAGFRNQKEDTYIVNPIINSRMQRKLVSKGYTQKLDVNAYLLSKGLSQGEIEKNSAKSMMYRMGYWLELDKKSIGEFGNSFYTKLSEYNRGIKRIIAPVGQNYLNTIQDFWGEATVKGMNQFLEAPLSVVGVTPERLKDLSRKWSKSDYMMTRVLGKGAKWLSRTHLGLIDYDLGKFAFPKYVGKFATKRILPAFLAWEAFKVTDHILGAMTFSKGAGPITTSLTKAYQWSTLLYSKISDITGFTRITKKQEKVAPGSTGLGFFVPALATTSTYKLGELAYKYGPEPLRKSIQNLTTKLKENTAIKKMLTPEAYKGALDKTAFERYTSWALKNPKKAVFSFMMLPMLPFLPGLLGSSKSYQERKAEYDGRKDVPIRKYRGWLLSSSPYKGGKVTHYRKHFSNLLQSDWENKGVIWPSYTKRALHDLSFGLLGRYTLEEYHAKSQPVYQSAPYGANIPLVGSLIGSTIGKLIKPTQTYHEIGEGGLDSGINGGYQTQNKPYSMSTPGIFSEGKITDSDIINAIGLSSEASTKRLYHKAANQFRDLIGFRGFAFETARDAITGKKSPEEYIPYAQDATEMYNPSQSMWQYQLGDISVVGGEFLRRLFVYPERIWRVNDIPNELAGVSWVPQGNGTNEYKKFGKDLTHGTTFDKIPMGWLYGSRKGWEFLYPTLKDTELEDYPDPIRAEILQSIAPYSQEFNRTAQRVMDMAVNNQLDPYQEQRYYDTLDEVRQVKDNLYAHDSEYAYRVSTNASRGVVTSVRADGGFTLAAYGDKSFQLAGVSLKEEDIRHELLSKSKYDDALKLENDVRKVQEDTSKIIQQYMQIGSSVNLRMADFDQMGEGGDGTEAIIDDLNERLIDAGAVRANTGNLAKYNMAQDSIGFGGSLMSKYWSMLVPEESYAATKLIPQKDYLENYLYNQVFNREVKLWTRPIEQILLPFIATELHRFAGIDITPSFTKQRRQDQEYWDVLKYIKYKTLASQANDSGNDELANYYTNMYRNTMIGANPTDDNTRDEMTALPQSERAYFTRFSNEPDPEKRGEIYKYLPSAAKRIYKAIWQRKEASAPNAPKEVVEQFERLKESEGWDVSDEEYNQYLRDTGGDSSLGDYIRTKYVSEYAKSHYIPDLDNPIWSQEVDIEDVELLTLREGGRNIEDYGFFENKARVAAFNGVAVSAALDINSVNSTSSATMGTIIPYLMSSPEMQSSFGMPTSSTSPIRNNNIATDEYDRTVKRDTFVQLGAITDALGLLSDSF